MSEPREQLREARRRLKEIQAEMQRFTTETQRTIERGWEERYVLGGIWELEDHANEGER